MHTYPKQGSFLPFSPHLFVSLLCYSFKQHREGRTRGQPPLLDYVLRGNAGESHQKYIKGAGTDAFVTPGHVLSAPLLSPPPLNSIFRARKSGKNTAPLFFASPPLLSPLAAYFIRYFLRGRGRSSTNSLGGERGAEKHIKAGRVGGETKRESGEGKRVRESGVRKSNSHYEKRDYC